MFVADTLKDAGIHGNQIRVFQPGLVLQGIRVVDARSRRNSNRVSSWSGTTPEAVAVRHALNASLRDRR